MRWCVLLLSQAGIRWRGAWRAHFGAINSLTYIPEGKAVMSASADCLVRLWDGEVCVCVRSAQIPYSWTTLVFAMLSISCASHEGRISLSTMREGEGVRAEKGAGGCGGVGMCVLTGAALLDIRS